MRIYRAASRGLHALGAPLRPAEALSPELGGDRLSHGAALLLIVGCTAALLIVCLGTGDVVDMMELFNLIPVREALRDGHWLMPTLNGVPRLEKPPLPVWMIAGLGQWVGSESLWVLRIPSLVMGVLSACATYGIGCTLFNHPIESKSTARKYGLLAAVLLPTVMIFNRQSRLASYDIFATAFLTCGAMFLLQLAEGAVDEAGAKKQLGPGRWWGLVLPAGMATGLSVLAKGPVPAATVMLPLGLWLLIFHRRRAVWAGVAMAALVSILVFVPWLCAIGGIPGWFPGRVPGAWRTWDSEFVQYSTGHSVNPTQTYAQLHMAWYYYFLLLIWVAPLTPLLVAGLALPMLPVKSEPQPSGRERRGRWLLWLVIVGGAVLLSVATEKKPRYALQLFPFASLLAVAAWQEFVRLPRTYKLEWPAVLVLVAQAMFFIVPAAGAIVGMILLAVVPHAAAWQLVGRMAEIVARIAEMFRSVGPIGEIAVAILLVVLLAAGWRFWSLLRDRRFSAATPLLAAGALLLTFTFQWVYRADPLNNINPVRVPAQQAAVEAGRHAVFTLVDERPWLATLYYFNRAIPELSPSEIAAEAARIPEQPVFLLVIVASDGKPLPEAGAQRDLIARLTGRRPTSVLTFSDENRETELIRFDGRP